MNLFALDEDPYGAAWFYVDRDVSGYILHYCKLLTVAHVLLDGMPAMRQRVRPVLAGPVPDTVAAHPAARWVRQSDGNYRWLANLLEGLTEQYSVRTGLTNALAPTALALRATRPLGLPIGPRTPWPQAWPAGLPWHGDPASVDSHRAYYRYAKTRAGLVAWTLPAFKPVWWRTLDRQAASTGRVSGAEQNESNTPKS